MVSDIEEVRLYFSRTFDGNKVLPLLDELERARELLSDVAGSNPYCEECHDCVFCGVFGGDQLGGEPPDGEHAEGCVWRRAMEYAK